MVTLLTVSPPPKKNKKIGEVVLDGDAVNGLALLKFKRGRQGGLTAAIGFVVTAAAPVKQRVSRLPVDTIGGPVV
ncbi:hypothetical protein Pmani_004571 [Petrolisthes manimaculis]|uniref:Uncharacterized protein n=1 Tax=Petrolisthes manimaculis TaxID=1843537 RepID=A0AAE1UN64_9EUCA|nr:hypothetical protein Pmani_004571 [Petrolisthes manimaculis]